MQQKKNTNPKTKLRSSLRQTIAVAATITVIGGSMATGIAASIPVVSTVIDGEQVYTVRTNRVDTKTLLDIADVECSEGDIIERTENDSVTLVVKRAMQVPVTADGETMEIPAHTGDTASQVLQKAGVALDGDDILNVPQDQPLQAGADLSVTRVHTVYVIDQGVARAYSVKEGTAAQSLAQAGLQLEGEDTVSRAQEPVYDGMVVHVNHVTYQEVQRTEPVAYQVVETQTSDLYQGHTQVKNYGKDGEKTVTYRQRLVNGEVESEEKIEETVTVEPVNQEVLVGTKAKPSAVASSVTITPEGTLQDANGNTIQYKQKLVGYCAAYTGGGITSTGKPAAVGRVAVNPNIIPYGSKLYICSPDGSIVYGYAEAADTGGGLMSGRILCDLYMDTLSECRNFGKRQMAVYILE